jgi:proline iminopeptidase
MFPALWTLPRYLSKVEEVRRGLGLDHFVLYGHSWGGMLAMEYALNYQQRPGDLEHDCRHSVVSKRTAALKVQLLSPETLARSNAMKATKKYENPTYTRIVMEDLSPLMICRLSLPVEPYSLAPWAEPRSASYSVNNRAKTSIPLRDTDGISWEQQASSTSVDKR